MLARVIELAFISVVVLVLLLIPLLSMQRYLRDQHVTWPALTLIRREVVRVEQGAFRDATAEVERREEVPSGIPRELKVLSWLSMAVGQIWPLLVFESFGLGIATCVEHRETSAMFSFLAGSVGMALWAFAGRSSWKASAGVLAGDRALAHRWLRRAVWAHGAMLGFVTIASGMIMLTSTRGGADAILALMIVPFALQLALAFLHEARFLHHEGRLPDLGIVSPVNQSSDFVLSYVRAQPTMDAPSSEAHESLRDPADQRAHDSK